MKTRGPRTPMQTVKIHDSSSLAVDLASGGMNRHLNDTRLSAPWPWAVGIVLIPLDIRGDLLREERIAVAVDAYKLGYFLVDTVTVPVGRPGNAGRARLLALAARIEPQVFILHGSLPEPQQLLDLEEQTGIPVHRLEHRPDPTGRYCGASGRVASGPLR
jgi:hypothetical protein